MPAATDSEFAHMRAEYRNLCNRIAALRNCREVRDLEDRKRKLGLRIAAEERRGRR